MTSGQVACPSTTATAVVAALNATAGSGNSGLAGRTVVLSNASGVTIYIGGDTGLTSGNGLPLATGASVTLSLGPGDAIYGRGASASPVLNFLATGA